MKTLNVPIGNALAGKRILGYVVQERDGSLAAYVPNGLETNIYPIRDEDRVISTEDGLHIKTVLALNRAGARTYVELERELNSLSRGGQFHIWNISKRAYRMLWEKCSQLGFIIPHPDFYIE